MSQQYTFSLTVTAVLQCLPVQMAIFLPGNVAQIGLRILNIFPAAQLALCLCWISRNAGQRATALQINHLCGARAMRPAWLGCLSHRLSASLQMACTDAVNQPHPDGPDAAHLGSACWEAHAQERSLPRGCTQAALPTLLAFLAQHSVSPCREAERRLEISSSVLFSSKRFFSHFSSLNKVGK